MPQAEYKDRSTHFKLDYVFTEEGTDIMHYIVAMTVAVPENDPDVDVFGPAPVEQCCDFIKELESGDWADEAMDDEAWNNASDGYDHESQGWVGEVS